MLHQAAKGADWLDARPESMGLNGVFAVFGWVNIAPVWFPGNRQGQVVFPLIHSHPLATDKRVFTCSYATYHYSGKILFLD
jgi:hypothetical protein